MRRVIEFTCAWCRAPGGIAAPPGDPSRILGVCAACRQRRRLEWAARRRTSVRRRADSEQLQEQSRLHIARAQASVTGTWARLVAAWRIGQELAREPSNPRAPARLTVVPTASPAVLDTLAPLTVLVIEDDFHIRDATRLLLEDLGARVLTTADGLGGLALVQAETPDIVLCDLRMPRLDGFEFIRRIRQNPQWARLPVVAVSAFVNSTEQERMRKTGFDATLGKPFDLAQLAGIVERLVHRRLAA
jgi:two-component system, cell cycle response regulator DivK